MKQRQLFSLALLAALAWLHVTPAETPAEVPAAEVSALTEAEVANLQSLVADVRVPELAAEAAKIVSETPEGQREAVAVELVKMIVAEHPGTAGAVVGAISKAAPETAPAVAGAASGVVKVQSAQIARAAAMSAPKYSGRVAAAVAKANPKDSMKIARYVISEVPQYIPQVISGISAEVPSAQSRLATLPQVRVRMSAVGAASENGSNPPKFKFQPGFIQKDVFIEDPETGQIKSIDTTLEFVSPPQKVNSRKGLDIADRKNGIPDFVEDYKKAR